MKSICTIIILLTGFFALGQFDPAKVNKKAAQLYSKALEIAENGSFTQSIQILQQAVKIEPRFQDAWLSIAGMYGEQKNYEAAIENYERAKAIDPDYFKDYSLPYSINLAGKGEFEKALSFINDFLTIPNLNASSRKAGEYRKRSYSFAVEQAKSLKATDYKFRPTNLGDNINSKDSEYYPT